MSEVLSFGLFPFCVNVVDAPPADDQYPLAFSLDECMELYWRVKRWRLTYDNDGDIETSERTISKASNVNPYIQPELTNEKQLVCRAQIAVSPNPVASALIFLAGDESVFYDQVANLYYPFLSFADGSGPLPADEYSRIGMTITGTNGPLITITLEPIEYWDYLPD